MKRFSWLIPVSLLMFTTLTAAEINKNNCYSNYFRVACLDDGDVSFNGNSIFFTPSDDGPIIEITDEYRLYIDGEEIEVGKEERWLLRSYYETVVVLLREAEWLGCEGAKIDINNGAALGWEALTEIVEAFFTDYSMEELEELEANAKRLEKKAAKLEDRGKELEELAKEFEKLHFRLKRKISKLEDTQCF